MFFSTKKQKDFDIMDNGRFPSDSKTQNWIDVREAFEIVKRGI